MENQALSNAIQSQTPGTQPKGNNNPNPSNTPTKKKQNSEEANNPPGNNQGTGKHPFTQEENQTQSVKGTQAKIMKEALEAQILGNEKKANQLLTLLQSSKLGKKSNPNSKTRGIED
ncbi:uncharacterized protein PGTG_12538 [Puccinia graminis f. sp. tritici CRL 75-36-700-3]|uniref:Uncharacterized protein n=1 Tax=Puccinia graminis f. sp. tritici (strain CRL 75-36-700-3 / race SCCL) TaxID=418459 RepID=E3KUZ1_PUCGT|nr:uncharacterized protein PGTG_12538 [Puccinia graminis f. sp. tritici CRL 75-36-700-3]EFP88091.1 hypothetical protein PGTG_12538 [Puccinia graminis f. sp. tritici CRL 75-36-700-3]